MECLVGNVWQPEILEEAIFNDTTDVVFVLDIEKI